MPKNLIIVESPAKAKTLSRYLGADYVVLASVGHVRDLPARTLGVDVENGFAPTYQVLPAKVPVVREIGEAAKSSEHIYLATDPDREGEAIAWHVARAAGLDEARTARIAFHQVTQAAVREAIAHPRPIDEHLVDAQQARRVLDRLVGYQISPLLSKTMHRRLSAGRVQSVALRLVVEREREIMAFVPVEYWSLEADLQRHSAARERFRARLIKISGQDPDLPSRAQVDAVLQALEGATYTVTQVRPGQRRRNPSPPFITSTLQAAASSRLRYSPRQTMALAQQLYEGIDLTGERVGLITYMRTDSTHVAPEAQAEARAYVAERWGGDYLPAKPPVYTRKVALAQEAHEAIRPTSVLRTPEAMKPFLTEQQARLYELIWRRFVASQMAAAVYDTVAVDVTAARDYLFRANGSRLAFPGFLAADPESAREGETEDGDDRVLPPLQVGEVVDLIALLPEQHFTEPPPRYSEATLIKALEENGVGRPSTYAAIITVIQDRGYVLKERGRLQPTDLGFIVCDTLVDTFSDIMDVAYTAGMEEQLDQVADGKMAYRQMLETFYQHFAPELEQAGAAMPGAVERALWAGLPADVAGRTCPECGRPLQVRVSDAGRFLGCSGYPDCHYTLDLKNPTEGRPEATYAEGETCELCGGRMKIIVRGRAQFLGCEHYPTCKNTRPILSERIKRLATETACPQCGLRPLMAMKGRFGEYLRCPQCAANYSLAKLGLGRARHSHGESGPAAESEGEAVPATTIEQVDVACPQCGQRPMERRVGRYGPYFRCPACKKNTSAKKMALYLGESAGDDVSD